MRQAIAYAIDKKTHRLARARRARARPPTTLSPSAEPAVDARRSRPRSSTTSTSTRPTQILDDAGYKDTNGDGIREMPGGGRTLACATPCARTSTDRRPIAQFITGWLKEIGIATTQKVYNDDQLTEVIGKGDYDLFVWGWTPFVDPDPMLSYFTCDQVAIDPKDPTNYYNDANWCDTSLRRALQAAERRAEPGQAASDRDQMLTRFYRSAAYDVLYYSADLQAYRKDRFTGFVRQPAEHGPGALHQHLADATQPEAGDGVGVGGRLGDGRIGAVGALSSCWPRSASSSGRGAGERRDEPRAAARAV